MLAPQGRLVRHVRTAFVSDVHLGATHAQPDAFLEYLNQLHPESLYIVGDFIDGWKLRSGFRWEPVCSRILTRLTQLQSLGTRLFYTPGNHDSFLRSDSFVRSLDGRFAGVEIADEFQFTSADGQRFLVTHGDLFDVVECGAQWLSRLSSSIYDPLLSMNRLTSRLLKRHDRSPYAFCAKLKKRVKQGVRFISGFEDRLLEHARTNRCDGVICGHIHTPAIVHRRGMTYCNTGDWVENCTALVESHDGSLSLDYYYSSDAESAPAPTVVPSSPDRSMADWPTPEPGEDESLDDEEEVAASSPSPAGFP